MRVRVVSLVILSLFSTSLIQAQERCGTVPLMQHLAEQKGIKQNTEQFEEWLQTKIAERKQRLQAQRTHAGPYEIPVVIHVIHNGEPYGTGMNIFKERIDTQLEVLNNDFKRLNADASNTPAEFIPVAGSMDIEFILAKQDPDGQPTDGIIWKDGGRASWSPFNEELHTMSYWPSEDYLNIWVTNISNGFVGYAQFPYSNSFPGLVGEADDIAETDGVVIDYTVFGVGSEDPDYNLGRTTTHEVGHFLGLRHIWGDANDCATDYVADTPPQEEETYGCEGLNHPEADACTSMKMFQNYMDYTDDACMNLFTADQVDRMITILESVDIPRRNSLLTSPGLEDPIPGTIDLQIIDAISPGPVTCNNPAELKLAVENLSEETITELKVRITVNGSAQQPITLSGLSLTGTSEISIPSSTLLIGENIISVNIFLINGATDPEPANNKLDIGVKLIYEECAPFSIYPNQNGETLITFDLPEENTVSMSIINTMGQLVTSATMPDVLNQTFILPVTIPDHTVYIVRLRIGNKFYSRKVYFHR